MMKRDTVGWRAMLAEAMRLRSEDAESRRRQVEAVKAATQTPEWRVKNAEKNRKMTKTPEWRQRHQMGNAIRIPSGPYSCLLPGVYPWLYKWRVDGKVYAR